MRYAFAEADITPTWSLDLAGFDRRSGDPSPGAANSGETGGTGAGAGGAAGSGLSSRGVRDRLACSVLLYAQDRPPGDSPAGATSTHGGGFAPGGAPLCLISVDLLWIGGAFTVRLAERIARLVRTSRERVMICATHTHSGPQTLRGATGFGAFDDRYERLLEERILGAVRTAVTRWRSGGATATANRLDPGLLINRIRFGRGGSNIFMAPNPSRCVDDEVRCLWLFGGDGATGSAEDAPEAALEGVVVNLSAHPVFLRGREISADYPGLLRSKLRDRLGPDLTVLFLQGFAGDLRPGYVDGSLKTRARNLLRHGRFAPSVRLDIEERMEEFTERLCRTIVAGLPDPFSVDRREEFRSLEARSLEGRRIALSPHPGRDADPEPVVPPGDAVLVQRLDLPGGVSLVGVGAEVFAEHKRHLDELCPRVRLKLWPVGCANGMYGYLPDEAVLRAASGYEYDSWRDFGRAGPLEPGFPKLLRSGIDRLFESQPSP